MSTYSFTFGPHQVINVNNVDPMMDQALGIKIWQAIQAVGQRKGTVGVITVHANGEVIIADHVPNR